MTFLNLNSRQLHASEYLRAASFELKDEAPEKPLGPQALTPLASWPTRAHPCAPVSDRMGHSVDPLAARAIGPRRVSLGLVGMFRRG